MWGVSKMKKILEGLAGLYFAGECYVLYCVGASCMYGQPFPQAAQTVGVALILGAALAIVLAALWLCGRVIRSRRPRRLGMIRMDRNGGFYYTKR